MESVGAILLILVAGGIIFAAWFAMAVRRVPAWGCMVVYRWGRTGPELVRMPGLRLVVPVADRGVIVDLREQVGRIGPQTLLTSDREAVAADLEIHWKIVDPLLSQVRVLDFRGAVVDVASQMARSLVAEMTSGDVIRKQIWLGEKIREQLEEKVAAWGGIITVVRVIELSKQ